MVDVHILNKINIWKPIFHVVCWLGVDLRIGTEKDVFKRDQNTCSIYANTTLNSIVNMIAKGGGGGLYDHLMSRIIFTIDDDWYSNEL